jgi:flagellar protein FlgJ
MSSVTPTNSVTDFSGLTKLRADARAQAPDALRQAAKQFEAMFTQMLLKASHSSDSAGSGSDLLGGPEANTYRDLYDQQMAQQLTSGHGLGIADMLVRQLQGRALNPHTTPAVATAAPAASTAAVASGPVPASPDNFVEILQPHAEKAASELGIPSKVLVAQAALETGWGQHTMNKVDGTPSNNYFGIKADKSWHGPTVTKTTTEYVNGVPRTQTAQFRAYSSPAEGFNDYVNFVKGNPRYADALRHGGDANRYLSGLQKAGYATDPAYASKISRIASGRTMQTAFADTATRTV